MFRTFNMGIGYVLVVPEKAEAGVLRALGRMGERAYAIGRLEKGTRRVRLSRGIA
jgi:phosphoribosylformylglycinamidine cyclo-ligase